MYIYKSDGDKEQKKETEQDKNKQNYILEKYETELISISKKMEYGIYDLGRLKVHITDILKEEHVKNDNVFRNKVMEVTKQYFNNIVNNVNNDTQQIVKMVEKNK